MLKLNLKNPLIFFDLETTGTNISTDRIVEISAIKMEINGETQVKTMRINPEMSIPLESSLIHGIYDEDVKDAPSFKKVAHQYAQFFEGADLSGFNILKFDIPMLVEEFLRSDIDFDITHRKIIDSQRIFHMMEKRNLSAAFQFYCGKTLEGAHGAEADTKACMEVLMGQVERYQGQPMLDYSGKEMGRIENDMEKLHNLMAERMVDLAGRIVYNKQGEEVFNFGKHKDKTLLWVFNNEPSYYDWMMKGDFPLDTKRKLTQIRLRAFNSR